MGYRASGWDPVHRPDGQLRRSQVVNLGYVVNVIEDFKERCETLCRAWALAQEMLIVSARLRLGRGLRGCHSYADGCLTSRRTFQEFVEQQELRHWIDQTLRVNAVPAAPGISYVFRDEHDRSDFISARYRRAKAKPRLTTAEELFTDHQRLLDPIMQFVNQRGRFPAHEEVINVSQIIEVFGSLHGAFRVVLTVTGSERWKQIRHESSQDLLVYLALSQFEGRMRFSRLSLPVRRDVKAFFGAYKKADEEADELLFWDMHLTPHPLYIVVRVIRF